MSAAPRDMTEHESGNTVTIINSVEDLANEFPDYTGPTMFTPSRAGLSGDETLSWERDEYEIQKQLVLARLLSSIDGCVIVNPVTETGYEQVAPLDPDPFGGLVVGCARLDSNENHEPIRIENPRYLMVLYAAALLIAQYEKELSHRVLNGAIDRHVDAVDRKYVKNKRKLENRINSGGYGLDSIRVSTEHVDVYAPRFADDINGLFE